MYVYNLRNTMIKSKEEKADAEAEIDGIDSMVAVERNHIFIFSICLHLEKRSKHQCQVSAGNQIKHIPPFPVEPGISGKDMDIDLETVAEHSCPIPSSKSIVDVDVLH